MSLEKFAREQPADYPTVAIRKNGTISLNAIAVEQFNLKEARFVGLYFDDKDSLIGIKAADQKDSTAFRVVREKGRTFTVSCQSFLRSIQIPYKEGTKIYKAGLRRFVPLLNVVQTWSNWRYFAQAHGGGAAMFVRYWSLAVLTRAVEVAGRAYYYWTVGRHYHTVAAHGASRPPSLSAD